MKIAYYPGCSGEGTSEEYDVSTRAVCNALDISLVEMSDWNCCGSTPAHAMDPVLSAALGARNLGIAGRMQADCVVTPCPSCLSNLKHARHRMEKDAFRAQVDALLDKPSGDLPEAYSVLQYISEHISAEDIARHVVRPLEGLKVATYYGCLMSRPAEVMQFDDPENPVAMDKLMVALGAEVVPFPLKTECCGASQGIPRKDVTASLSGRILERARDFGAEAVVTACPLCHMNLDLRQHQAEKANRQKYHLPVFYYTQLMAFAFGLSADSMLLDKHAVNPSVVLANIDARRRARVEADRAAAAVEEAAKAEADKKAAESAQGGAQ